MRFHIYSVVTVVVGLISQVAAAHEGHGHADFQQGPVHYLASPQHALPWLLAIVALVGFSFAYAGAKRLKAQRAKNRDPLA